MPLGILFIAGSPGFDPREAKHGQWIVGITDVDINIRIRHDPVIAAYAVDQEVERPIELTVDAGKGCRCSFVLGEMGIDILLEDGCQFIHFRDVSGEFFAGEFVMQ
jgi:hypothetical protein